MFVGIISILNHSYSIPMDRYCESCGLLCSACWEEQDAINQQDELYQLYQEIQERQYDRQCCPRKFNKFIEIIPTSTPTTKTTKTKSNLKTDKKQRKREMKRKERIADKEKKAKKRFAIQELARDDLSVKEDFTVGLGSCISVYTGNTSAEVKRRNDEEKRIRDLEIQKYWEDCEMWSAYSEDEDEDEDVDVDVDVGGMVRGCGMEEFQQQIYEIQRQLNENTRRLEAHQRLVNENTRRIEVLDNIRNVLDGLERRQNRLN